MSWHSFWFWQSHTSSEEGNFLLNQILGKFQVRLMRGRGKLLKGRRSACVCMFKRVAHSQLHTARFMCGVTYCKWWYCWWKQEQLNKITHIRSQTSGLSASNISDNNLVKTCGTNSVCFVNGFQQVAVVNKPKTMLLMDMISSGLLITLRHWLSFSVAWWSQHEVC